MMDAKSCGKDEKRAALVLQVQTRLSHENVKLHFRDEFRTARYAALGDAEAFEQLLHTIERFGSYLSSEIIALDHYAKFIAAAAFSSPLSNYIPQAFPYLHTRFTNLYALVQRARNDAMHQGAFARHLTVHAVELAIVLEDALMTESDKISDFMVKSPTCASMWQPLSFVRQTMLANSFSYMPVDIGDGKKQEWRLISDWLVSQYLRTKTPGTTYKSRLMTSLKDAFREDEFLKPHVLEGSTSIRAVLAMDDKMHHVPILVTNTVKGAVEGTFREELLGILTPFDVL